MEYTLHMPYIKWETNANIWYDSANSNNEINNKKNRRTNKDKTERVPKHQIMVYLNIDK